jgi:hypothetical protein
MRSRRKKSSGSKREGGIIAEGAHKRLRKKSSRSTRKGGIIAAGAQEREE